jgi:cell division protein FtsX
LGDNEIVAIFEAMTTSNDRLDRIEALVEKSATAIDKNATAIDRLTDDIGRFNERLDTYEKGMRWVVQLAFALLISATVALIVNAAAFLVRLLLPN